LSQIDPDWALDQIAQFLWSSAEVPSDHPNVIGFFQRDPDDVVAQHAYVVEQILARVLPAWRSQVPEGKHWEPLRNAAGRAKAILQREEELRIHLGDNAPEMDAGRLHPWAWENGASYWRTGHYHQAVMQAAIRVNAETQAKVGRMDVSETNLFNEVFKLDSPKPDAPRLRIMPDDGSDTYRNVHRGARAFAEGLFAAIRNPGMHRPAGAGDEHLALEQLAAFSILARWVDEAKVQS
jgi:hypothetical protein